MHTSSFLAMMAMASGAVLAQNVTSPTNTTTPGGTVITTPYGTCDLANPTCPGCAGQDYVSPLGDQYNILCAGVNAKRALSLRPQAKKRQAAIPTFAQCIDTCDIITGCQSVVYNPNNGACSAYTCLVLPTGGLFGAEKTVDANGNAVTLTACPAGVTGSTNPSVINNFYNINSNYYTTEITYNSCTTTICVTSGTTPDNLLCEGSGAAYTGQGYGPTWTAYPPSNYSPGGCPGGCDNGHGWHPPTNGTGSAPPPPPPPPPSGSGSGYPGSSTGPYGTAPTYMQSNKAAALEHSTSVFFGVFAAAVAAVLSM